MPAFGSILMPTRKVLTSNDPAWVISGHNFVVGGGEVVEEVEEVEEVGAGVL